MSQQGESASTVWMAGTVNVLPCLRWPHAKRRSASCPLLGTTMTTRPLPSLRRCVLRYVFEASRPLSGDDNNGANGSVRDSSLHACAIVAVNPRENDWHAQGTTNKRRASVTKTEYRYVQRQRAATMGGGRLEKKSATTALLQMPCQLDSNTKTMRC